MTPPRVDEQAEKVREIQERAEAATPGPWSVKHVDDEHDNFSIVKDALGHQIQCSESCQEREREMADSEFIAHAREDIPWLAAELVSLREERDHVQRGIAATVVERDTFKQVAKFHADRAVSLQDALDKNERDARWIVGQWQRLRDEPVNEVAKAIVARCAAAREALGRQR